MPSYFFHIGFDIHSTSLRQVSDRPPPPSTSSAAALPRTASKDSPRLSDDWRYGKISLQTVTMATALPTDKQELRDEDTRHMTNGISVEASGSATKGHYEPCEADDSELGWGVVRLYRDADETPGLYEEPTGLTKHSKHSKKILKKDPQDTNMFKDEECTILCIPAVPSYLTPSDFLGFVGEKTRDDVSHFRMVRTERSNRYMVLMKFRDGKRARQWRHDWNGKAFDGIEVC